MHNNVNTGGGVPSRFPIIEEQSRRIPSIAVSNVGDNLNHRPRLINQYQTSVPNAPIMFRPHYHHHNNNSFNNHHNHRYLYEPYSLSRPGENRYVRPPPSSQCGLLLEPHHGYCPPSQQNQPQRLQSPSSVLNLVCHRPISLSSHSSIYNGAASAGSVANSNSYVHHVHHGNSDHQMKPNSSLITPSPPLAPLPLLSQIKMASLSQQQHKQQQVSSPPASSSNRNSSNKSINNKNVSKQQTSQQALGKLLNNNGGSYERLDAFLKPRPPHSRDIVPKFYRSVIDDVMASIREIFLDDGIDEQVIQEMKQTWERKVMESPAVEQALQQQQQQQQVSTISSTSTTNTNSSKQSEKSSSKTSSSTTSNSAGGQTTSVITSNPNHVNKNGSSSSTNSNSNNKNNSRNNKNSGDSSSSTTKSSPNTKPMQTTNVVKQTTINPNTNVMVNANQSSININSTGSSQTQQPLTEQLFRASAIVPNNSIGMTAALASASPTITTTPSNIVGGGTANILGHIPQQQPHPSLQQTALLQEPQKHRQDDLKKMREADEIRLMQEQQQRQEFRNVSPQSMPINLSTTNQYLMQQQRNASPDMARNYVNDRHYVDAILNNHHQQNNIDNSIAATQKYYAAMLAASSPSSLSNSAADAHRFQLAMNANHGSGNDGGSNIPGLIGRSFGINQSNSNNNKEVKFQPGMPPGGQKIVFLPNLMQGGPLVINQDLLNSINLQQGGIITSGGQPIFQHPGLGGGTIQYTTAIRPGGPLPHGMPQGVALHQPTSTIQPIVRPIVTLPTMVSAVPQPAPQQMAPQQTAGPTITRVAQLDGQQDQNDSSEDDDDDDEYRDNDDDLDDNDDEMNDEENEPGVEEEPLNSEDDVSDEDPDELFETDNVVVCQFDKITRSRNKWKFHFKDGIMNLQGKDYVFSRAVGDAEW